MPALKVIVALGKGAHDQILRALTVRAAAPILHPQPAACAAIGLTLATAITARATTRTPAGSRPRCSTRYSKASARRFQIARALSRLPR